MHMTTRIFLNYLIAFFVIITLQSIEKVIAQCPQITINPTITQQAANQPALWRNIEFEMNQVNYVSGNTIDVLIDWGDGNTTTRNGVDDFERFYHKYTIVGNFNVTVSITAANYGVGCTYPITDPSWGFTAVIPREYVSPDLTITQPATSPLTICVGDQVDFIGNLVGTFHNGDLYTDSYDINWSFNFTGDINNSWQIPTVDATGASVNHTFNSPGTYRILAFTIVSGGEGTYRGLDYEMTIVVNNCCFNSFSPIPNKKYVLSAWVREVIPTNTVVTTYNNPAITLSFDGSATTFSSLKGKGPIIDGWQRIEEEFIVPSTAVSIKIDLENLGTNDTYFDDIRIHPFNANMQSYVYDPDTKRLAAVLDENNYGMIYEYDEEGALIRVKKETERGIKTATESFNNLRKN